jgi:hypothetical protein
MSNINSDEIFNEEEESSQDATYLFTDDENQSDENLDQNNTLSISQKFNQKNILEMTERMGQSYLLLSIFEKIKTIVEEHNEKVKNIWFYSSLHKTLNTVVNEIDEEIQKIKPRYFRKVVREMLFFRELAFEKYLYERRHVIRLFIFPASIIILLDIILSIVSSNNKSTYLYCVGVFSFITLIWIVTHAIVNFFSRGEKWALTVKFLWKISIFSFSGVFLGLYLWTNDLNNVRLYVFGLLLGFLLLVIYSILTINGCRESFNVKMLNVFGELNENIRQVNKKVINNTLENIDSILLFEKTYEEKINRSEILKRIYIKSLRVADSLLNIECKKRAQYTSDEKNTVKNIYDMKKKISASLKKNSVEKYIGSKKLPDLVWELVKDIKSADDINNELIKDGTKTLSSFAESYKMDGDSAVDKVNLGQMLEWVLKLTGVIMSQKQQTVVSVVTGDNSKSEVSLSTDPLPKKEDEDITSKESIQKSIDTIRKEVESVKLSEEDLADIQVALEEIEKVIADKIVSEIKTSPKDKSKIKTFLGQMFGVVKGSATAIKDSSTVINAIKSIAEMAGVELPNP